MSKIICVASAAILLYATKSNRWDFVSFLRYFLAFLAYQVWSTVTRSVFAFVSRLWIMTSSLWRFIDIRWVKPGNQWVATFLRFGSLQHRSARDRADGLGLELGLPDIQTLFTYNWTWFRIFSVRKKIFWRNKKTTRRQSSRKPCFINLFNSVLKTFAEIFNKVELIKNQKQEKLWVNILMKTRWAMIGTAKSYEPWNLLFIRFDFWHGTTHVSVCELP